MKTNPEMVLASDVDDTLIFENFSTTTMPHELVHFNHPYDGRVVSRKIHKKHIQFLKDSFHRGYYIVVWSGNGKAWCDAVVEALGIKDYVHNTMTKPIKILDDLPCEKWMGNRIYLEE